MSQVFRETRQTVGPNSFPKRGPTAWDQITSCNKGYMDDAAQRPLAEARAKGFASRLVISMSQTTLCTQRNSPIVRKGFRNKTSALSEHCGNLSTVGVYSIFGHS